MIASIAIALAALGILMLLVLYSRIRAAHHEGELKKHRSRAAGFADLLNYAAVVDDGVIVGKNGSFMAAWLYQGDDNASSTEPQREMVSFRINQALSSLGNGWMVHVDAVRRPAPGYSDKGVSHFPDPVSAAIDEERRRLFEQLGTMYEGYFVLSLTYFPPLLAQRKFVEMMFDDDAAALDHKAQTQGLIDYFKRAVKETVSTEIVSVIPQTGETWQVDWIETVRDRQGVAIGLPFRMRALITVYTVAPTAQTTEEHMRNNPLGIYVRDFSWSKQV